MLVDFEAVLAPVCFERLGAVAEVRDLRQVLPSDVGADGETAARQLRQLEPRLRHLVGPPRNRRGAIDEHLIAEEPVAIARSSRDPARPGRHIREFRIEAVLDVAAIAEHPCSRVDAAGDDMRFRKDRGCTGRLTRGGRRIREVLGPVLRERARRCCSHQEGEAEPGAERIDPLNCRHDPPPFNQPKRSIHATGTACENTHYVT